MAKSNPARRLQSRRGGSNRLNDARNNAEDNNQPGAANAQSAAGNDKNKGKKLGGVDANEPPHLDEFSDELI